MGRYEEAVADLTQAIDLSEAAQPRTHYLRAIAQMQLGDNAAAIPDLDVCVTYLEEEEARMAEDEQYMPEIDADVLYSRYYRGIAHMQAADYEAAIADFTSCVEDGRNAEDARFWRGACYLDTGEYALALEDFAFCRQAGVEEENSLYYTAPVSYTHLDVYKRQAQERSGDVPGARHPHAAHERDRLFELFIRSARYAGGTTGQICEHHAGEGLPAGENGG